MKHSNHLNQQSGAALVIGLIILLVMTLLSVSSMSTTRTELKIASNIQNKSGAFLVAEAAVQQLVTNTATQWGNILTAQTFTYEPVDTNLSSTVTMEFADCRNNPLNYDLSGDGIGDGKGSNNKATIHRVNSTGISTSPSGSVVASSTLTVGISTVLAGCTPPAP